MNETVELQSVPGCKEGCTIDVRLDDYNDRQVRLHIKRLRDIMFDIRLQSVATSTKVWPVRAAPLVRVKMTVKSRESSMCNIQRN